MTVLSVQNALDALNSYDALSRRLLFALVCYPRRFSAMTVREAAAALAMDPMAAYTATERFSKDEFLFSPVRSQTSGRNSYQLTHFQPAGLTACLMVMSPADVLTAPKLSKNVRDTALFAEWKQFLTYITNPQAEFPATLDIRHMLNEHWDFQDAMLFMLTEPRWNRFFAFVPEYYAHRLVQKLHDFLSTGCKQGAGEVMLANLRSARLPDLIRAEIEDYFTFLRLFWEGNPAERAGETTGDTRYGLLTKAALELSRGNGAAAMKFVKKSLKAVSLVSDAKSFEDLWSNFIAGVAAYEDRKTPVTQSQSLKFAEKACSLRRIEWPRLLLCAVSDCDKLSVAVSCLNNSSEYRSNLLWGLLDLVGSAFNIDDIAPNKDPKLAQRIADLSATYPVFELMWLTVTDSGNPRVAELEKRLRMKSFIAKHERQEVWESELDRLLDLSGAFEKGTETEKASVASARVAYLVDTAALLVKPVLQKTKDGLTWSAGRNIAIKTFADKKAEAMTAQDKSVADCVREIRGWYGVRDLQLDGRSALLALAGHPYVFEESSRNRLEVLKGEVQLSVTNTDGSYAVSSNIDEQIVAGAIPDVAVLTSMPGRIEVIPVSSEQKEYLNGFRRAGALPAPAKDKLTTLLERLSQKMPVMSDLMKNSEHLAHVKGSCTVTLQLAPGKDAQFSARAVVRPLAGSAVVCEPGAGLEYVAMNDNGKAVQVVRDLKAEKEAFQALTKRLEFLDVYREEETRWSLDVAACLELLEVVREMGDVALEWPQGAKFFVKRAPVDFSNVHLSVNRVGSWFDVEGELAVDGNTKLAMAKVLELVRNAHGNFIAIGNGEYVALAEGLKKQLAALERLSGGGKTLQVSVFNAGLVGDMEKMGAVVDADREYRNLQARIEQATESVAKVPVGLNAELRDYQEEGFQWMSRLSLWGAGAILADDMGLGKTVQTIAVLLDRAQTGPQLVVVPASVLFNWRDELMRFAPSLKQVILNSEEDRDAVLKKARKGTVVLATYGILVAESDSFATVNWGTAVFDEAHAIKNRETKAFKAAVALKADFRILLTGTPLQNHLAEIWALFEVAVPGLLGSFARFTDRFVLPVERDHDREQQRVLKRLVTPFILRRTKTDVLNELPEKTEVTVKVELSKEEKALYEELREETRVNLESGEINPIQALANLMKLRQASCAAELVDENIKIPSSKTQAFLSLARELIENHHRALVFSQFTSHLALIRRELDQLGIQYLYLDGTKTPAQRRRIVSEFEEGSMPLFLISLKAGGTGLNLTAADYVIHMDPWWNPAIEDQASDRAYRIGQERPVTIYRLIAAGTVEEKILKLHATKKSLADALLEGTEISSRLGKEEILELLSLAQ